MLPDCRCHLTPFVSTPAPTPRRSTASVGVSARAGERFVPSFKGFWSARIGNDGLPRSLLVGWSELTAANQMTIFGIESSEVVARQVQLTKPLHLQVEKNRRSRLQLPWFFCRRNAEVQLLFSIQNEAEHGTFVYGKEPVTVKPRGDVTSSSPQYNGKGIRRNLEKSCLDLIDFLLASDSIVISDYELNRATNYGVPDVNVPDRTTDADGNPISLLWSDGPRPPSRPLIPFRGRVRRWPTRSCRGICLLMNHSTPPPPRTDSFRFPRLSLIHSGISRSLLFAFR